MDNTSGKKSTKGLKLIRTYIKKMFDEPMMFTLTALIVLCIVMAFFSPQFLSASNISNVLRQVTINSILATGMTFVIISSRIDLSVGSIMAFSGTMMAAAMADFGIPIGLAILIGILIGAIFGTINGVLIAYAKLPAIIVTLAMMQIPRGLALLYTGGYPLNGLPDNFSIIGRGYLLGIIPVPVVIMAIVYIIAYIMLNHLAMGRYIYSIGGNEEAVRLSGIKTKLYIILPFVISGITAAIGGTIITSRLMSGQPMAGEGFELDAIAAVVLGGTDIAGGRGHIVGTLIGAIMLGVLTNGLNLIGVSPYIQRIFKGLIIIAAVYLSSRKRD